LCARLDARRAAAHALLAAAAAALRAAAGDDAPRCAALAALLAAPMPPDGCDDETAHAADLAAALLRRAALRAAVAAEEEALRACRWSRLYGYVSAVNAIVFAVLVMPEPLLSNEQLHAAAFANVQLRTLQYLRLEAVRLSVLHAAALLISVAFAVLGRAGTVPLLRRVFRWRHHIVASVMTFIHCFHFWFSLRSAEQLPQLPRVHPLATVVKLLFSMQLAILASKLSPGCATLMYLLRAAQLVAAAALPRCLLLPRSWLTRWTMVPHVGGHLVLAARAWRRHQLELRLRDAARRRKAD
jgi:hypothetical protein